MTHASQLFHIHHHRLDVVAGFAGQVGFDDIIRRALISMADWVRKEETVVARAPEDRASGDPFRGGVDGELRSRLR